MGPSVCLLCAVLWTADQVAAPTGAAEDSAEVAQEPKGGVGVSPVELVPRVEIRQSFLDAGNGVSIHETTAEIDIQFLDRVLLRYQVPHQLMETPKGQVSGFGDTMLQAIAILAAGQTYAAAVIVGAELNTASQPQLGAGKQQLLFGGGAAYKPFPWWLAYGVVEDQVSVAGDSTRPNVNQLDARLGNIIFGKRYNWWKLDLDTTVDVPTGTGRFFGTLEVGSLLIGRVGLFVRTGTQLLGERQLDYSLAGGVRYLFRLEKGKPKPQ